jgi:hypothetical protein
MKNGAIAALLVVAIIASGGVGYFVGVNSTPSAPTSSSSETTKSTTLGPLAVYENNCTIVYFSSSEPNGGSICSVPINPVNMPISFTLSSVSGSGSTQATGTLQDVFFGFSLESGQAIRVSMNSTSPIILRTYLDNRTAYDVKALDNEAVNYGHLLTNQTGVTTYEVRFLAQRGGLYIYELTVNQPNPVPNASFDIQSTGPTNQASTSEINTYLTSCVISGVGGFEFRVVSDSTGALVSGETIKAVDRLGCNGENQVVYLDYFPESQEGGGWLVPDFPTQATPAGQLSFNISYQGGTYNFTVDIPPIGTNCVTFLVPSGGMNSTTVMNGNGSYC